MSGRATGDIVADLRDWIGYMEQARLEDSEQIGTADQVLANMRDAADRLTELDAEVTAWKLEANVALDAHRDALTEAREWRMLAEGGTP